MERSPNSERVKPVLAALLALVLFFLVWQLLARINNKPAIRIGVLHSLSGTMAVSEAPLVDAVRLAVEQVNQSGGVNGAQIEMIVVDCRSEADYCAQQAEKLITQDGVKALFGCWTSACRKAVKPVVEKHHHLLFYPLQYEGLEESPDIFYTGAVPNQQIIPALMWAMQNQHRRFYLLGSDYVYPHTANRIARDVLHIGGGAVAAERYVPLGDRDFGALAAEIARLKPDIILNTLNGDSNGYFFAALHDAGITAAAIPVISTSIAESDLARMGSLAAGNYAVWSYFQNVDTPENKRFVAQFRQRFGADRVLDDPMEASYIAVNMWVNAAREAGTTQFSPVKTLLGLQTLPAPEGIVSMDGSSNHHLWKTVRIGKARADGQLDEVWQSGQPVRPAPYPYYRTRADWDDLLGDDTGQAGREAQP